MTQAMTMNNETKYKYCCHVCYRLLSRVNPLTLNYWYYCRACYKQAKAGGA